MASDGEVMTSTKS